ncbi:hypothetical protein SPHINGO361_130154 [Sphingomonas sp. EC-HK361]|nr:hypothetical protein SPHINGO361_130154 [Sphingomonas sp. EC-HK361]
MFIRAIQSFQLSIDPFFRFDLPKERAID